MVQTKSSQPFHYSCGLETCYRLSSLSSHLRGQRRSAWVGAAVTSPTLGFAPLLWHHSSWWDIIQARWTPHTGPLLLLLHAPLDEWQAGSYREAAFEDAQGSESCKGFSTSSRAFIWSLVKLAKLPLICSVGCFFKTFLLWFLSTAGGCWLTGYFLQQPASSHLVPH